MLYLKTCQATYGKDQSKELDRGADREVGTGHVCLLGAHDGKLRAIAVGGLVMRI